MIRLHPKNLLLTLIFAAFYLTANAQIELPAPSPSATFSQKVGLTKVTINYSRPSVKDRAIFGDLVPYGELWRTGANMATKIEFSENVKVGGKDLKAGTYALFTIPGENEWTIILNTNYNQGGTGQYKESEDAARFTAKPVKSDYKFETFTILIDDVTSNSANIAVMWDNTVVKFPVDAEVDSKVMAAIDKSLTVSPDVYFQAATYYHDANKDLNKALEWISTAIEGYEKNGAKPFWVYRKKSLIEADLKKYKDAIATAEKSKSLAAEAGNQQYVKFNEASIAEWKKMK